MREQVGNASTVLDTAYVNNANEWMNSVPEGKQFRLEMLFNN